MLWFMKLVPVTVMCIAIATNTAGFIDQRPRLHLLKHRATPAVLGQKLPCTAHHDGGSGHSCTNECSHSRRSMVCSFVALVLTLAFGRPTRASEGSLFEPYPLQKLTSRATASLGASTESNVYRPPKGQKLPYTTITDNTQGKEAFADILGLFPSPRPGRVGLLLLDVGAGKSNSAREFLASAKPEVQYRGADPYNRSKLENATTQQAVEDAGGADVATSMSVLNVIREPLARAKHIQTLHDALRPSGTAFFKVWAGYWPARGTGEPYISTVDDTFQANAWASAFLPEVEAAFGKGQAYADNDLNLIVAVRSL